VHLENPGQPGAWLALQLDLDRGGLAVNANPEIGTMRHAGGAALVAVDDLAPPEVAVFDLALAPPRAVAKLNLNPPRFRDLGPRFCPVQV
jgi:hypothetical protein